MIIGFQIDPDSIDAEQAGKSLIFDMGDRIRVIHDRAPGGSYYKDFPLLTALPATDGQPTMSALDPSESPPLVYFDFDVSTSDPATLRFAVFDHYQDKPVTTVQHCMSEACVDDLSRPVKVLNKTADITGVDPLPPCFEPKMEMMRR